MAQATAATQSISISRRVTTDVGAFHRSSQVESGSTRITSRFIEFSWKKATSGAEPGRNGDKFEWASARVGTLLGATDLDYTYDVVPPRPDRIGESGRSRISLCGQDGPPVSARMLKYAWRLPRVLRWQSQPRQTG
jgi:hypothetical protein